MPIMQSADRAFLVWDQAFARLLAAMNTPSRMKGVGTLL